MRQLEHINKSNNENYSSASLVVILNIVIFDCLAVNDCVFLCVWFHLQTWNCFFFTSAFKETCFFSGKNRAELQASYIRVERLGNVPASVRFVQEIQWVQEISSCQTWDIKHVIWVQVSLKVTQLFFFLLNLFLKSNESSFKSAKNKKYIIESIH